MANSEIGAAYLSVVARMDKGFAADVTNGIGGAFSKLGGIIAAAGVGKAVVDLTKAAVGAYSQYEQMVGGVDKLFGSASGKLQQYAAQAYQTSGLSANQYMEQATSFSASMISSLGGDVSKAADMTDLAMRSMADNVNVFGSSMEDVQNAFQGFSKQNYTMLDNLKLGYGGTKSEMQRLIQDASTMTAEQEKLGVTVDANSMSFSNITAAIAVMQEHMGIAGTTSREAAGTIEGSVNMMKASWANFLTALGSGEGISDVTSQLLESVGYVAQNVGRRVLQVGDSIAQAIPGMVPKVSQALANMWNTAVGALQGQTGIRLPTIDGSALAAALDSVTTHVSDFVSNLTSALGGQLSYAGVKGLADDLGSLLGSLQPVADFISGPFATALGTVAGSALNTLVDGIRMVGQGFGEVFAAGGVGEKVDAAGQALGRLGDALSPLAPLVDGVVSVLAEGLGQTAAVALAALADTVATVAGAIAGLVSGAQGAAQGVNAAFSGIVSFVSGIPGAITGFFSGVAGFFSGLWNGIKATATGIWNGLVSAISSVPGRIVGFFASIPGRIGAAFQSAKSMALAPLNAIATTASQVVSKIRGFFDGLHISLPTLKFPSIKLPHFSVSGGKAPFGIGGMGSLPHFSVSWYAKGGLIAPNAPQLIGVGDAAEYEHVTPDTMLYDTVRRAMAERGAAGADGAMVVTWLERNLGDTIADRAPRATPREFRRMVGSCS